MYNIPVYLYNIICIIYLYLLYIYLLSILYIVVYICKSFSIFEFNSVQINHFYLSVEISISHYYLTLKLLNTGTVCPCRPALQGTFCLGSLAWPDHPAGLPSPLGFSHYWSTGEMEQKRRQEEREVWNPPKDTALQASFAFLSWIETQILCLYLFYRILYSKLPLIDKTERKNDL